MGPELPFEHDIYELEQELSRLEAGPEAEGTAETLKELRRKLTALKKSVYSKLGAWETVLVSRHRHRPQMMDYVDMAFEEFVELHGDRAIGDDRAIRTGFARLDGHKVLLIGHQKGKTI